MTTRCARLWGLALCATALLSGIALGAPPKLVIPADVKPNGEYATIKPETDAVSVIYVGLSGVDAFPSDFLKDARHFVLPTRGLKDGVYRFAAVGAGKDGEQTRVDFAVTVGTGTPAPNPVPTPIPTPTPNPTPIPNPPPVQPAAIYFFVLVKPDGPTAPEFTRIAESEAWAKLAKVGHKMKPKTLSESNALGIKLDDGTRLPTVVVLQENAQTGKSKLVTVLDFPKNDAEIEALPKGVK